MLNDDYFLSVKINDTGRLLTNIKVMDVNLNDSSLDTLLHYAVKFDSFECARLLLENGALPDKKNINCETPLFLAAKMGKDNFIKLFLRFRADINNRNHFGETPFHMAVLNGNLNCIKTFIDAKVDIRGKNDNGQCAVHYAIKSGSMMVLKYIIDKYNFAIDIIDQMGNNLLHYACNANNIEMVSLLLNRGVSVHTRNKVYETPLFNAVRNSSMNIIYSLIEKGAVFEIKNMFDETVSEIAQKKRKDSFEYLESLTYNRNYQVMKKKYPLHYAILIENKDEIRKMINEKNYNKKNNFGYTPYDLACQINNNEIKKILS